MKLGRISIPADHRVKSVDGLAQYRAEREVAMKYTIALFKQHKDKTWSEVLYETTKVDRVDIGTCIDENIVPFLANADNADQFEIYVEVNSDV